MYNADAACIDMVERNPNLVIPWLLMAAYLYYWRNLSLLSDGLYDQLARGLKACWGDVHHFHKAVLPSSFLSDGSSSLFTLAREDFPLRCRAGACAAAREFIGVQIELDADDGMGYDSNVPLNRGPRAHAQRNPTKRTGVGS